MAQTKDREWLKTALAKAVGWDAATMEGVADAIATAECKEEIDELVQDYLGGGQEVRDIVQGFYGNKTYQQRKESQHIAMSGKQPLHQEHSSTSNPASARGYIELSGGRARQGGAKDRPAGSMTIIHKQDKRKAAGSKAQPEALDRTVANCLCCGKVYDCRMKSNDIQRFVETGGICTFCSAKVALSSLESSEVRAPAVERSASSASQVSPGQQEPSGGAPANPTSEAHTAEAIAFKNRLVDYDRNAAKRTTVIDDQSDFFEIDSNAWLTQEERQQLKERQRALEEAEKERKRAVTVTFDLLGRQVILANDKDKGPGDIGTAGANADLAASAAPATAAEIPQGGGTALSAAAEAAGIAQNVPMVLQMRPNPGLSGPSPVFMRRTAVSKPGRIAEQPQPLNSQRSPDFQRLQHDDLLVSSFQTLSVQ